MALKSVVFFCATVAYIQVTSAQCIGNIPGAALGAEEIALSGGVLAYGSGAPYLASNIAGYSAPTLANYGLNFAPTGSGGSFAVTSSSPISPTGIRVISENAIEGALSVIGELPFLSAVSFESALPSAGGGAINYGCGSGAVGIVSENIATAPAYGPAGPAYGAVNSGYSAGRFGLQSGLAAPGLSLANSGLAASGFTNAGYGAPGLTAAGMAASGIAANNLAAGFGGQVLGAAGLAGPGFGYGQI